MTPHNSKTPPGRTFEGNQAGARCKLVLLTWLAVYPTMTLLFALLGPTIAPWPLPLRTLALSSIMVPIVTIIVMPRLSRMLT